MTSQLVIFRAFFLISPETTVKLERETNSMYKKFKYFIIFLKSGQDNHFLQCHSQKYTERTSIFFLFFFQQNK